MYVIDNGSTDDTKILLEPHISTGFVSYFYVPEPMSQKSSYNTVYKNHARDECDWLMVNDVDEYVFGVSKPFNESRIANTKVTFKPPMSTIWTSISTHMKEKNTTFLTRWFV
uniref:Glycosyltransferase 2-like domain-containing protein n=1 Tax=viral metagenome TaxID=1070528 RepID=A0A6C0CLD3_9ZZZZ